MQRTHLTNTKILGIVNITEDSFSDGGQYLETEKAIQHAIKLYEDGADVIDLGAASSHPNAKKVKASVEIQRLTPVINALQKKNIPISIDTFQTMTQEYGIQKNVTFLNDIQGFPDPTFYSTLKNASCKLIVMHSVQRDSIADKRETDPNKIMEMVIEFFEERINALIKAGIDRSRLILDPGMGFFLGSNVEPSLVVLKKLPTLKKIFDLPLLISVSRKSFLQNLTGCDIEHIGPATLATELFAITQGADYIRTHDVGALHTADVGWAFQPNLREKK